MADFIAMLRDRADLATWRARLEQQHLLANLDTDRLGRGQRGAEECGESQR